jgi:hypothetical protein
LNTNNICFRHGDRISTKKHRSKRTNNSHGNVNNSSSNNHLIETKSKSDHSFLCSIRIAFGFVLILMIMVCLISSLIYVLDLFIQNSCRLVHYDQPLLISLITGIKIQI